MIKQFPTKKYQVILADPPWNIRWQGSSSIGTKPLQYPTLTMVELVEFGEKVKSIAEDCSKLFMWTTNQFLPEALGLLKFWGFQYDKLWTWCKKTGAGGHPRNATEHLIESSRGALKSIGRHENAVNNWFVGKKGKHSVKPIEAYELIEYCYPKATKIELFARNSRAGWDCWGYDAPNFTQNSIKEFCPEGAINRNLQVTPLASPKEATLPSVNSDIKLNLAFCLPTL